MNQEKFKLVCKRVCYLFAILLIILLCKNTLEVREIYNKKNNIKPNKYIALVIHKISVFKEKII